MNKILDRVDGFGLSILIVVISVIVSVTVYHLHQNSLMSQNMNTAIEKGIDPLSVRCSYVHSQDLICVAFAASSQSHNMASQIRK